MSIDSRCREQRNIADSMFMDFKYTPAGSMEQLRALNTLSFLLGMWAWGDAEQTGAMIVDLWARAHQACSEAIPVLGGLDWLP